MTFKEILDNILLDIDEEQGDTILENKLKKFINRGYKELAKKEGLIKLAYNTLVDGKCKVPGGYNSIYNVKLGNDFIAFSVEGNYIVANYDGDIEINYSYIPVDLEDDDSPLTNPANEEFILSYAKYLYFMSDSQIDLAKLHKIDCETFKIIMKSNNLKIIDVYGGF